MPNSPKPFFKARDLRPNSSARGYDARWRRFRVWFLARHPQCEDCGAFKSKGNRDLEIHHLKKVSEFPELQYVESNLKTLCGPCHAQRTARGE